MKLFLFLIFCGLVQAIDQYPIATWTCNLCATGSPLSSVFLPPGRTCSDLDTAMKNLGKSGCTGLSLQSQTNITDIEQLQLDLDASRRSFNLAVGFMSPALAITTLFSIGTCIWVRRKIKQGEFTIHKSSFPGLPGNLLQSDSKQQYPRGHRTNWGV